MREIKFRGKRVDKDEWVYGDLRVIKSQIGAFYWICDNDKEYKVIPETVGQYTGKEDRKGKEIYEGDKTIRGYVIMWSKKHCLFCEHFYQPFFNEWSEASYPMFSEGIEIIGIIHENPKLLK